MSSSEDSWISCMNDLEPNLLEVSIRWNQGENISYNQQFVVVGREVS